MIGRWRQPFCDTRRPSFTVLVFVSVFLLFLLAMRVGAEESPPVVRWADGLLTVQASNSRLSTLLEEITRQTGVPIYGAGKLTKKASVEFSGLPLDAAMKRLVSPLGYAFLYQGSSLAGMWVILEGALTVTLAETGGGKAEVTLLPTALDPDPIKSQMAYDLLLKLDRQKALEAFFAASMNDDPNVRFNALQALASLDGPDAVLALGKGITDSDPGVRTYVVQALGEKSGSDVLGYLEQALYDEDSTVRILALSALNLRGRSGQTIIRRALTDPDEAVRSVAAELLDQSS
jgi:HEAT repeat protein